MIILSLLPSGLRAEELEMINRPVNTSGLSGLLITTSPYTLPPWTLEIGVMTLWENSMVPDYTATAIPLTISLGTAHNGELALKGSYAKIQKDTGTDIRGTGDMELAYKWNFRPQREYSNAPGIAFLAAGIVPTGDKQEGTTSIDHWGARLGFSLGSELTWEDYILGLFADAQVAVQDLSDKDQRDRYTIANAGLIFPISKYRNLQMILEYNLVAGKDAMEVSIDGVNHSAVTYGLRLVSERFNLTLGTQFIHKTVDGYNDSSRLIGIMSVKL
jgi:hypothetical protein